MAHFYEYICDSCRQPFMITYPTSPGRWVYRAHLKWFCSYKCFQNNMKLKERKVNRMIDVTFDYSKLKGKIKEVFGTQSAFAAEMQMSRVSLSKKLNNKMQFSQKEIDRAVDLLKIKKEEIPVYFFTPKVQEPEL